LERVTLRAVAARLWVLLLGFLLFCHLNHSRYWWQELVCSFSLYWIPFVLFGVFISLRGVLRRGHGHRVELSIASALGLLLIVILGRLCAPYIYFSRWPALDDDRIAELSVLFTPLKAREFQASRMDAVVSAHRPDIVVVMGEGISSISLGDKISEYPVQLSSLTIDERSIRVFSRFALAPEHQTNDLGYAALPAMYVGLEHPVGGLFELGALQLVPAFSAQAFDDNRTTSRRLATLVRNSSRPRVVVGSFFGSQFSQIVSMYARQGRLRSVMFDRGFMRTWDMHNPLMRIAADHGFVSRHFRVREVATLPELDSEHLSAIFKVAFQPAR